MIDGVEFLHSCGIVHRNLNLRNIFLSEQSKTIKLGDFLICKNMGPIYTPPNYSCMSISSYHFYAPEIWMDDGKNVTFNADIWSLGVLLYVMTCGYYPFEGTHEFDILYNIKRARFLLPEFLSVIFF